MTISVDEALDRFQPALPQGAALGVALSGGADSSALLAGCAQRWPGQVIALHVNHGLQAAASQFEAACQTLCSSLNLPLRVARVDAGHASGQSPEDAARIARYSALASLAGEVKTEGHIGHIAHIALAQHADDQVETLLLALSRGAGPAGLAAMPAHWERMGLHWHRPLLEVAAADIRHWLRQHSISWVEDPTNADPGFTRNRIRADLLPPLQACFPHFRDTFARAAQHSAAASELLDELADIDLLAVLDPGTGAPQIKALQLLRAPRQANALRHWLKTRFATTPSTAQLLALLAQITACTTRGHHIDIRVGSGFVRREGAVLRWYNSAL
jgi:tRNA(Ile)-lysidine synthase